MEIMENGPAAAIILVKCPMLSKTNMISFPANLMGTDETFLKKVRKLPNFSSLED